MSNIGKASIEVGADTSGFESQVRSRIPASLSRVATQAQGAADRVARSWGQSLSTAIPKIQDIGQHLITVGDFSKNLGGALTKYVTVPAVGAATAVGGIALAGGFKRLVGIDTARGQFKGLGLDADAVMAQVDKGVTDTSLSMAQGASLAVAAMATGNLPLKDLEGQITRVANVSAAYGVEAEHAGYLLNNVLTKNKVTWGDLSQMQMNNIPIVSQLADHYGVTGDEIQKMAQEGAISVEDLNKVIDQNAGKAAEEYANTWRGVTSNIIANVGKVSAAFLEPSFDLIKEQLQDFLEVLRSDDLQSFAEDMGARLGEFTQKAIDGIKNLIEWWNNLSSGQKKVVASIAGLVVAAGPMLSIFGRLAGAVGRFITSPVGQRLTSWAAGIAKVIGSTGLAGMQRLLGTVLTQIGRFAKVGGIFGIVIAAITAVWQHSEGFRDAVANLWETFKSVLSNIASKVGEVFGKIGELFGSIGAGDGPLGQIVSILLDTLAPAFTTVVDIITIAVQVIGDVIVSLLDIFIGFMDVIIGLFTGDWQQVWDGVVTIFTGVWETITSVFQGVWEIIAQIFTGIVETIVEFVRSGMEVLTGMHESITGWLDGVMQSFSDAVVNFFSMLGEWIASGWESIVSFFQTVWVLFKAVWTTAWNSLVETVSSIWQTITNAISTAWNFISTLIQNGLTVISAVWSAIWSAISSVASSVWSAIVSFISSAINSVRNTISSVMNAIRSVISSVWNAIRSVITSVLNGIRSTVTSIWNGIRSTITSVLNGIRSVVTSIWNGIRSTISSVLNGIRSTVSSVWNSIRSAISSAMNSIRSGLASAWNAARNLVTNAVNGIRNAVTNGFNRVVSFISSIPGRITSALGNLGSLLTGAGRSLIDGFLGGIKGAWGKVTSFVKDGLGKLRNLLPFSPAKEGPFSGRGYTLYSGQALIEDFARGIQDQEQSLTRSMRSVADNAANALSFTPDVPNIVPRTSGLFSAVNAPAPPSAADSRRSAASDATVLQVNGPLVSVENMSVDSDTRVKEVAQDLYTRSMRQARARGKVDLSGVVEK